MRHVVMVVDDDAAVLEVARQTLAADYDVVVARSAAEALRILKTRSVHVLLADQRMPVRTGTELLREARRLYEGSIVRLLYTGGGGLDGSEIAESCRVGDTWRFIDKPWDSQALRAFVESACVRSDSLGVMLAIDDIAKSQAASAELFRLHAAGDEKTTASILSTMATVSRNVEALARHHEATRRQVKEHGGRLNEVSADLEELSSPGVDVTATMRAHAVSLAEHSEDIGGAIGAVARTEAAVVVVTRRLDEMASRLQGAPTGDRPVPTMVSLGAAADKSEKDSKTTKVLAAVAGLAGVATVAERLLVALHVLK